MPYRPPTMREVEARVNTVAWWFGFAVYGVVALVAYSALFKLLRHHDWLEPLVEFLWLPCGVVAFVAKNWIESYLLRWVPE